MCEHTRRRSRINQSWFRHWQWWVLAFAIVLLGIALLLDSPFFDEMAWFALVAFTLLYARSTAKLADEAKEQRLDSCRPLLVPVGGILGIGYIRCLESGSERLFGEDMLHVHNIGVGPAENIAIRLELRSGEGSATVQLDEMLTFVEPLASGGKGLVRQWQTTEKAVDI